jgi:membrane protease YdiL (CAAX protease family)
MNESESRFQPRNPRQTEKLEHYPGPMAALGITFAAVFAAGIVASMFGSRPDFGAIGVGQVVGFGFVAILSTQRIAQPHAERLGLRSFQNEFLWVILFLLPSLIVMSELDNIIRDYGVQVPVDPETEAEVKSLFDGGAYGELQRLIVIVGLAPVMEEWLFRGVIQQGLIGNLGRYRGLILTAALFALCRLAPGLPPSTLLSFLVISFTTGFLLGVVRIATGSLLAPIVLHMGFNFMGWAANYYRDTWPIQGFNVPDSHTSYDILLASGIATYYGLINLKKHLDNAPNDPSLDPSVEPYVED